VVALLFLSPKEVFCIFTFYNKHKRILSIFLCVMLVCTIIGSSYIESHAFAPVVYLAGAAIASGVVALLAYMNAVGYRTSNEADAPAFGNAVYDDLLEQDKAVFDTIGAAIQTGATYVTKMSHEAWVAMRARIDARVAANTNTYSFTKPVTLGLLSYNSTIPFIQREVVNFVGSDGVVYFNNFNLPGGTGGWVKSTNGSLSAALQNVFTGAYYTYNFPTSIPQSAFPVTIVPFSGASATTSIPLDPSIASRRTQVPPLPFLLPTVAADGSTSIPYDPGFVDTLPADVVTDMAPDVALTLTDALTVPDIAIPESTTGNVDLDQVKLPLTLKDKFPFCIPFDFLKAIGMLRANPVAPKFDYTFSIASIGFTEHFIIDLSMFDSLAVVLRWFLSLLFTVLLIVATRRFIL